MSARILYCHCAYAQVLPADVKREVLQRLTEADVAFETVPDLCEMSARNDPALRRIAGSAPVRIAACWPRAVQWLFHASDAPLPAGDVEVLNMREEGAATIVDRLLSDEPPAGLPAAAPAAPPPDELPADGGGQ